MCLVKTKGPDVFHDLTSILSDELRKSGIKSGILNASILHTTCALAMQEPDKLVHADSKLMFDSIISHHLNFEHTFEGVVNAKAHQKQFLIGNSKTIPVRENSLLLGTWQRPFLIEFFRQMERKVLVTIIGE